MLRGQAKENEGTAMDHTLTDYLRSLKVPTKASWANKISLVGSAFKLPESGLLNERNKKLNDLK